MSDFKTQDSSPDQLGGGNNFVDRRGNESSQSFPLSGRSGVNVDSSSSQQRPVAPNVKDSSGREAASVSGMSVTGRAQEAAKPVDFKTITGSYAGDHRSPSKDTAKDSLNRAADNGGPRSAPGQFALGKNDKPGSFKSWPGDKVDNSD